MKCAAQRLKKTLMIYLFVWFLGITGPLLEDLDGRDFFGFYVCAHSDFTKAAGEPEVLKLVVAYLAVQHVTGFYL